MLANNNLNVEQINEFAQDGHQVYFSQLKQLIQQKHGLTMANDDPLLLVATMLNVFIGEIEKINEAQKKAMSKVLSEQAASYVADVKAVTSSLGEVLKNASLDAIRDIFNNHVETLAKHRQNMRWCAAVVAVSALANVAALAFGG